MLKFFQFLFRYRSFLIFLAAELLCFYLIFRNNTYQQASFINSSNRLAASILSISHEIGDYFRLAGTNGTLAEENAMLRQRVEQLEQSIFELDTDEIDDPQLINKYQVIEARVINNSIRQFNNYITIDKGSNAGIEPGMGVLGPNGVVGQVKTTSPYFSVVYSMLHSNMMVSARIGSTGDLCSVQWDGSDPAVAKLLYVPRHVNVRRGDLVVTSGFNSVFPEEVPLGTVLEVKESDEDIFLEISMELATDFSSISYVYLIRNTLKPELDSLQSEIR